MPGLTFKNPRIGAVYSTPLTKEDSMHSLTVTIGRNYTNDGETFTLSDGSWLSFQEEVRHLLGRYTGTLEQHLGIGYWQGIPEESAKITLLVENSLNVNTGYIRVNLERLARTYDQDAIALTIGESELIEP